MICNKQFLYKFRDSTFVETGSHRGDTIQLAIDCGFNKVISIELSDYFYNECKNRFKGNSKVHLVHGDSAEVLWSSIENEKNKMTFWLDGHYSGLKENIGRTLPGDTAFGKFEFPIIQELEAIEKHPIKNNTILIDDIRCWADIHVDIQNVINKLKKINNDYIIERIDGFTKDDILLAYTEY